jgi:hypothetical protein
LKGNENIKHKLIDIKAKRSCKGRKKNNEVDKVIENRKESRKSRQKENPLSNSSFTHLQH